MKSMEVIAFDWGGTLMKLLPYQGAMVTWEQVEAVDGIQEALEKLHGRFKLVVATNATDSSAEQVIGALRRVGLDTFFNAVHTYHTLGAKKPSSVFYHSLTRVTGCPPGAGLMVGDEYRADVMGAKLGGWRSVWYNPQHLCAPAHSPAQDADVVSMVDLPALLDTPTLPDREQCIAWLQEKGNPHNVLAHVQAVAAAAYQLAVWLRERGESVDPILTHRGGLLHDIARAYTFGREGVETPDHASQGSIWLAEEYNQPELSAIVDHHMLFNILDPQRMPITWEQKLVYYADKLAEGPRLGALEKRMNGLQERYDIPQPDMDLLLPAIRQIEQEISDGLRKPRRIWFDQLLQALKNKPASPA